MDAALSALGELAPLRDERPSRRLDLRRRHGWASGRRSDRRLDRLRADGRVKQAAERRDPSSSTTRSTRRRRWFARASRRFGPSRASRSSPSTPRSATPADSTASVSRRSSCITRCSTGSSPHSPRTSVATSQPTRFLRVAFFQDEQAYLPERIDFCREYGIDLIYTCIEAPHAERVYAPSGAERVVTYLPGYVSRELAAQRPPQGERPIDIGYRGRKPPPRGRGRRSRSTRSPSGSGTAPPAWA